MLDRIQIQPASSTLQSASTKTLQHRDAEAFAKVLQKQLDNNTELRFSAHAQERLDSRGINLSSEEMEGIGQAVEQAAAKGSRESLVLTGRVALVVNVPKRTIITALANNETKDTVFTNIDSAVVVPSTSAPQSTT